MRYITLLITLIYIMCTKVEAQTLSFDKLSHSLGTINLSEMKDSVVYYDFKFTNTGGKPLKLSDVVSSCGCTTSEWSRGSYEPGTNGTIRMSYRPQFRDQQQVSMVAIVYSNSGVHNLVVNVVFEGDDDILLPDYKLEKSIRPITKREKQKDIYDTILRRAIKEFQIGFNDDVDTKVEKFAETMRSGGYWHSIDYDCRYITEWQPIKHLENISTMALAYVTPASKYYGSTSLFEMIEDGLRYWDAKNPRSTNWWHNQISASQVATDVFVLMYSGEKELDKELFSSLCGKLNRASDPRRWTGANKLDIAKHHIYRGCIMRNDSVVRVSSEQIFYPVVVTKDEGIQEDMSYHQHGAQLYMGGYGIVFAGGISEMAYMLRDTPYSLSDEKLELFCRFIREGFMQVFRGRYIDWSVVGRSISRRKAIDNIGLISKTGTNALIERMMKIDSEHKPFYVQVKARFNGDIELGVKAENRLFYRSDYMVHNRKKFQATVRTASNRVAKTERGNGENLFCTYLSDGAFNIRQQGDEYNDIFPVWQWDKIPGVTSRKEVVITKRNWQIDGTSKYTAGVSDGVVGAFAYKHDDHGFKATKGWFFWDDMVVALGAGITSNNVALHTTLEQSNLRSQITFNEKNRVTVDTIVKVLKNPKYVVHNQMAYVPLQEALITLSAATQSGSWIDINYNQPSTEIKKRVFNLTWEHPKGAEDASYSYIQIPACSSIKQINGATKALKIVNKPSI